MNKPIQPGDLCEVMYTIAYPENVGQLCVALRLYDPSLLSTKALRHGAVWWVVRPLGMMSGSGSTRGKGGCNGDIGRLPAHCLRPIQPPGQVSNVPTEEKVEA